MNPIDMLKSMSEQDDVKYSLLDIYIDLFLEISKEIKDKVYLKGNILLNKLLPDSARATNDLDMSIVNEELYNDIVKPLLEKFGDVCVLKGYADSYAVKEIQEKMSGGIKVIKDNITVFSVDVSLDKSSWIGVINYTIGGTEVKGSSINKIMADKCLSTLSRKRFRRAKDFYDLYIIKNSSMVYDIHTVVDLMIEKVGLDESIQVSNFYPFIEEILVELDKAWVKLELRNMLNDEIIDKPLFVDVYKTLSGVYYSVKKELSRRS